MNKYCPNGQMHDFWVLYLFGLKMGLCYLFFGKIIKGLSRLFCPIHYTRYQELPITLKMLAPEAGEKVLDISSPKILSIFCARRYFSEVTATDILDQPLEEALFFKKRFDLDNLHVQKEDARHLSFPDNHFDKIFSVSVFEHIAPAWKGEIPAIREAARVLKPGGVLVLTVAFANSYFEEYRQGAVYEREANGEESNFFQRFYDEAVLRENIIIPSGMEVMEKIYIGENLRTKHPGSTIANWIDAGKMKTLLFGPFQPILSCLFLTVCTKENESQKNIIVCLKMKKHEQNQ